MTTAAKRDYYDVLGISRNADEKAVRSAYRRLARQYHPDLNPGNPAAEQRFKEIGEAYEVLSDPAKRRLYDRYGHNWQQAQRMQEQGLPFDPRQGATGSGFPFDLTDFGDLDDFFAGVFGRGSGRTRTAVPTTVEVQVTLEEAYHGAKRVLDVPSQEMCSQCQGTGSRGRALCGRCRGRGSVTNTRRIEAAIPPGVDTGSQVRLGLPGRELLLQITVLPDSRFQRQGADLETHVSVPLYTALLGGEVKVSTPKGGGSLNIPLETQNGRVFRLTGQGMPHHANPSRRGDLYVTVDVMLPTGLSPKEKELLGQLRALRSD